MFHGSNVGAAAQIRTGDLILTKDALYRLSYSSIHSLLQILLQMRKREGTERDKPG